MYPFCNLSLSYYEWPLHCQRGDDARGSGVRRVVAHPLHPTCLLPSILLHVYVSKENVSRSMWAGTPGIMIHANKSSVTRQLMGHVAFIDFDVFMPDDVC